MPGPARMPVPVNCEVVRYQSPSGEQTRVTGRRDEWGRFQGRNASGRIHAALKPIALDDGSTVWMESARVGLRGGHPGALDIAAMVLRAIRQNHYHGGNYKSENKFHTLADEDAEVERILQAKAEIGKFRDEGVSPLTLRGHNCGELTEIAVAYGAANGWSIHRVAMGPTKTLHGFAIVGPRPEHLPDDFTQWPESLAICDPWANIACPARAYPGAFQAKMQKWERAGKDIFDGDQEDWVKATDSHWVQAVLHGPKSLY